MKKPELINASGKLLDLRRPLVMGIINITDNSFYPGSRYMELSDIVRVAVRMSGEGADIIDVGACSTRPGSRAISPEEERGRLIPALKAIRRELPGTVISADSYRAEIASGAVQDGGADMLNDISGGSMDDNMFAVVADLNVPYVMMHMKGTPPDMQLNPEYDDVVAELIEWFGHRTALLLEAGVKDVIIDPGIGFGKTIDHNFEIISRLGEFCINGLPLMIGLSRKSLIWKTLDTDPAGALNGTTAVNMAALMNGADILRVHDVKEAVETVRLFEKLKKNRTKHE